MKSFKILIAAAAVTAVLFSGCQKEVFTGIDKSKAGVTDFTYDEIMSSPSTVSLVWNPSAAKTAGATSFSVQLAKKEDFWRSTHIDLQFAVHRCCIPFRSISFP